MKIKFNINKNKILKSNIIKLVKHHRKYCEGENCNISLWMLLEVAKASGLKFTKKEEELFI